MMQQVFRIRPGAKPDKGMDNEVRIPGSSKEVALRRMRRFNIPNARINMLMWVGEEEINAECLPADFTEAKHSDRARGRDRSKKMCNQEKQEEWTEIEE